MKTATAGTIRLFQFPRMFAIPNLSPFCSKMETWLRIAGIPYQVVDTPDPRRGPRGKLPFIEDGGVRIADSSVIIDHLKSTRGIDPDASLDDRQRAVALVVQRTLEEHYAFVLAYTHLVRAEGIRRTRSRFDAVPAIVRPLVERLVTRQVKKILWFQGTLRRDDAETMAAAIRDWTAILELMSDGPYFFGAEPSTVDAIVFATLATTVLTPIDSPVRDFLSSKPRPMSYVEGMRSRFFPELAAAARAATAPAATPSRVQLQA
jgi:glutathione S-transferase